MPITKIAWCKRVDSDSPNPGASARGDVVWFSDPGKRVGRKDVLVYQPVPMEFADEAEFEAFQQLCGKQVEDPDERESIDLDDSDEFDEDTIEDSLDTSLRPEIGFETPMVPEGYPEQDKPARARVVIPKRKVTKIKRKVRASREADPARQAKKAARKAKVDGRRVARKKVAKKVTKKVGGN